jgi:hypothetical protein
MRKAKLFSAFGAVVFIGAAIAVRYVAVPALQQLPANLDTTVHLTGKADLVDQAAMQSGDLLHAIRSGVEITADHHTRVTSVHGRTAVVVDESTTRESGQVMQSERHTWAVDRRTLADAPPPAGSSAEPHHGLVVGFPLSPKRTDYPYWDTTTGTVSSARYVRTEQYAGHRAFVYEVQATGPVKDAATLAKLPTTLPKSAVTAVAALLTPQQQQLLASVAANLPNDIPLEYAATSDLTFWVDSATGWVMDVRSKQTITVSPPSTLAALPLRAQVSVELQYTPDSVYSAVKGASDARQGLFQLGTLVPLALLLVALVLVVFTLWPSRRRRRQPPVEQSAPAEPVPAAD